MAANKSENFHLMPIKIGLRPNHTVNKYALKQTNQAYKKETKISLSMNKITSLLTKYPCIKQDSSNK
jgi:hypothetical protein